MKKMLSFLFPIKLKTYETRYNGVLHVNLLDGKKVLDTAVSNYSYGSLQRILYKGLKRLPFNKAARNILVLGMGAGSIVQTIRKQLQSDAHIVLIEIDKTLIGIANEEFLLDQYHNIDIIEADAARFMQTNTRQFDLVIADLFIIDTIPAVFTQTNFLQQLANSLVPGGQLLYNTISDTLPGGVFDNMVAELSGMRLQTSTVKNLEGSNDLILGTRI